MKVLKRFRIDKFILRFFSSEDPLASGDEGLDGILDVVEHHMGELTPEKVQVDTQRDRRYSRTTAMKQFAQRDRIFRSSCVSLLKEDKAGLEAWLAVRFFSGGESRLEIDLEVTPFDFYRDDALGQKRIRQLLSFVREMARRIPPSYAYGHSRTDESMGSVPPHLQEGAPKQVEEVYWLNVYGRGMVESLGRERTLSIPATHLEELPHGGVLFLTRATPGDFASDEARVAQAMALAHLNPEFSFDSAMARQRQRSAYLAPVEQKWDPDLVELLEYTLDMKEALKDRPRETARLNAWRPPPISEWTPLKEAPSSEGEGVERALLSYTSVYAEGLQLMLEKEVPEVKQADPASLTPLDKHFWSYDYPRFWKPEELETKFVPLVGSYLGELLVQHLGGRWVARRKRDECYVALGDRAWLPFLRARNYLQSQQSVLDHSMTKFYREAERHVRSRPGLE